MRSFVFWGVLSAGCWLRAVRGAGCETIRCGPGEACDNLLANVLDNPCVPVSCDSENACPLKGFTCEPIAVECIRSPCPQFRCEPDVVNGCSTTCGEEADPFSVYHDDGANYCNVCFCLNRDRKLCTPWRCPADEEKEKCEDDRECVICTQAVPQCEEGCENCLVEQQTCETCSTATCLD